MHTIIVTGAAGSAGRRLVARLAGTGYRVVAIDRLPSAGAGDGVEAITADLRNADLGPMFDGADIVVHLAAGGDGSSADVTRLVLEAVGSARVTKFIHRSSALVYGAWPGNPVPLTEDRPIRPNTGFLPAVDLAEAERLVDRWASAHPAVTVTVLRPTLVLVPGEDHPLARHLGPDAHRRADPTVVQYLAVDDLVEAILHVIDHDEPGAFNVAPQGWIAGDELIALAGGYRLPIPDALRDTVQRWAWKARLSPRSPAARPWLRHPWVIAADRLAATGWKARATSEEVVVAARRGSWWRELSPKRRQEVTLAGSAVALGGLGLGLALVVRRVRRR